MKKLEITGKETQNELALKLTRHISLLSAEMIGEVIMAAQSAPDGLQQFIETQLRAQEVGVGAMRSHLLYYIASLLQESDKTCFLTNLLKGMDVEKLTEKEESLIYMPVNGVIN